MPHHKMEMIDAVHEANSVLAGADPEVIAAATSLGGLAATLGMGSSSTTAIGRLYDETQAVILAAVKTASENGRPVYVTWRHDVIQRVQVTSPERGASGLALDIEIHSRYDDDGHGPNSSS